MLLLGVPVVLAWVAFACIVIWYGLNNDDVLNNIDGYTTLIAIIGGPALLILTSMLELWKQEQTAYVDSIPDTVGANRDLAAAEAIHARGIASATQAHEHSLEAERQQVDLGLLSGALDEDE